MACFLLLVVLTGPSWQLGLANLHSRNYAYPGIERYSKVGLCEISCSSRNTYICSAVSPDVMIRSSPSDSKTCYHNWSIGSALVINLYSCKGSNHVHATWTAAMWFRPYKSDTRAGNHRPGSDTLKVQKKRVALELHSAGQVVINLH